MWTSSLLAFLLLGQFCYAQDQQLWLDFQMDHPFANKYLLEGTASYQTVVQPYKGWRNISLQPTFEYQYFNKIDFIASMPMAYTMQKEDVNSFEFDPSVAARYSFTQGRRVDVRLIPKLEERIFRRVEASDWETSTRIRLKGEAWIAINGPNLFTDKLWYAIVDYEEYFVMDQQLDERYAFRRRARLGAGYRLDYRNRFELIYTVQSSRDEIYGEFQRIDNVLQLRYKIFFNPASSN